MPRKKKFEKNCSWVKSEGIIQKILGHYRWMERYVLYDEAITKTELEDLLDTKLNQER